MTTERAITSLGGVIQDLFQADTITIKVPPNRSNNGCQHYWTSVGERLSICCICLATGSFGQQ